MASSIDDAVTLLCGDARAVLDTLPAQSVHTCITSPSYFGLRDYGCAGQIGLEATPQEYVAALVDVFRGVKRVLRDDGTLWVVLGDSYNSAAGGGNVHLASSAASVRGGAHKQGALSRQPLKTATLRPKSLLGIPWRVAFALQDDGWILRQEIVWHKPNPMPESVRDRCSRGHETVFMLAKKPIYYYDQDAIREPHAPETLSKNGVGADGKGYPVHYRSMPPRARGIDKEEYWGNMAPGARRSMNLAGRNKRSVWTVATAPLSSKKYGVQTEHYAAFPPELVRPMVRAATSEKGVCPQCGAPWRRAVERDRFDRSADRLYGGTLGHNPSGKVPGSNTRGCPTPLPVTTGWQPTCSCGAGEPVPATVADIFCGSGTTGVVAVQEGRRFVGIDLNPAYVDLARRRIATAQPPLPVALAL